MTSPLTTIDLKRLAAEVSVQHGIRVDADDPIMAVATLNRLVLEQAVAQMLDRVQASIREFDAAVEKIQIRAGGVLAQEVRDCGVAMRQEVRKTFEEFRQVGQPGTAVHVKSADARKWLVAGLALAMMLFGFGIWVGAMMR
jgi:hypothetical protein